MKEFEVLTEADAENFFRNNMRVSIKDGPVLDYMVGLLMDFMRAEKNGFIFAEKPYSVIADELMRQENRHLAYAMFKGFGDAFLWLCGYVPEHIAKKKKSKLGLEWYIEKGRDSYNFALSIANAHRIGSEDIRVISRVSDDFEICSRAILEMRIRASLSGSVIEPQVLAEIQKVLYGGREVQGYLASIAGKERPDLRILH